jgi:hypothetical protein
VHIFTQNGGLADIVGVVIFRTVEIYDFITEMVRAEIILA